MTMTLFRIGFVLTATLGLALLSGCTGSCVGTGGIVDECKPDWTQEECDEWDSEQVNDADWTLYTGSCVSLGYDVECGDGSFVKSTADC